MNKIRIYFILLALTAVACNKDELITTDVEQVPIITFDTDPAVYPVKVGREFTITPSYQFVDRGRLLMETGRNGQNHLDRTAAHLPVRFRQ